jgi:hypothetical protein
MIKTTQRCRAINFFYNNSSFDSLVRKFFLTPSSPIFLLLNSDSPGSRFIKEPINPEEDGAAVFSVNRILGSAGTTMAAAAFAAFEKLIFGNCKLTGGAGSALHSEFK